MSAIVLQSHADLVPQWIRACTGTVRAWAVARGYEYRLIGDELFDGIPLEVMLKAQSRLPPSDLGRLMWMKRLLQEQEFVVWVDSDVVVFDEARFHIDLGEPFLVCREILVRRGTNRRKLRVFKGYNPTVLMFGRDSAFLDKWLEAIHELARSAPGLGDAAFGREMLNRLAPRKGLPAVASVGHFNAVVLGEIFGHDGNAIRTLMAHSEMDFAAANLCAHYQLPAAAYSRIISRLLSTGGGVVNDLRRAHLNKKASGTK